MSNDHIPLVEFGASQKESDELELELERPARITVMDNSSTKPALIVGVICFFLGVTLLIPGAVLIASDPPPTIPYVWSISLCPLGNGTFIGVNTTTTSCSDSMTTSYATSEIIDVPSRFLDNGTPYKPFLYVTDRGKCLLQLVICTDMLLSLWFCFCGCDRRIIDQVWF